MSNSLRSILLGTALLDVMLVIALGLTVLRLPSHRPDTTARDRVISLFLIGIVYIASGPVEAVWRWRTGRPLEELPKVARESTQGTPS